jgi:hypothetical protein
MDSVLVPGKPAEVIKVGNKCYRFVGFTDQPPDSEAAGLYETCDDCCPGGCMSNAECLTLGQSLQLDFLCPPDSLTGVVYVFRDGLNPCRWLYGASDIAAGVECASDTWRLWLWVAAGGAYECPTGYPALQFYKLGCDLLGPVGVYVNPNLPGWNVTVTST